MRTAVIGLGLIGASFAKSLKNCGYELYGYDISDEICSRAADDGVIDGIAFKEQLKTCELIIVALYPQDTLEFLRTNAEYISEKTVVVDCAGVKRAVCVQAEEIARKNGFIFIGGHPMAGKESFGYFSSDGELFRNASMLLTPSEYIDQGVINDLKTLFASLGFKRVVLTTPEEHDRIIAYTSQLAHIVSSSYIKSPTSLEQAGFSAGSFKDMTRVAYLNEKMWTELFMDNRDNLINEIDILQKHLEEYRYALARRDKEYLYRLLKEGRLRKEKTDSLSADK